MYSQNTNSMGGRVRKFEKLIENGHWNFQTIIALKTSLVNHVNPLLYI